MWACAADNLANRRTHPHAFIFCDGVRVWPRGATAQAMHAFVSFRRYQLVQLDHERIEFRYIPDGSGRNLISSASRPTRTVLHPSIRMSVRVWTRPQGPSGKVEESISHIAIFGPISPPLE